MDADDISLPMRFEKQIDFLEHNLSVGICGMGIEYFGEMCGIRNFSEQSEEIAVDLLFQCALCHPTVMIRKSMLFNCHLGYDCDYEKAEDYRLWCQAITNKINIVVLKEIGLRYRIHKSQITQEYSSIQIQASNKVRKNYFDEIGILISDEEMICFNSACNKTILEKKEIKKFARLGKKICSELKFDKRFDFYYLKNSFYQLTLRLTRENSEFSRSKGYIYYLKVCILFHNLIRRLTQGRN